MTVSSRLIAAGLVFALLVAIVGCGDSSDPSGPEETFIGFFRLGPTTTYLHVCLSLADPFYDGGVIDVVPILLADYGLAPGDEVRFEAMGDYHNGNGERTRGMGVFSSSGTLLATTEAHRVPDAIDAGDAYVTNPTWGCGNEPTDIPEDFAYEPTATVTIPGGATHLFLCVRDSWYADNTDLDDDCGVNVWKIE
jgi:hypothetical protein